jgi:hypothetical protein
MLSAMHCLVVGGTRILRPAVGVLAAGGQEVSVVARTAADLALLELEPAVQGRVHGLPVDHGDAGALAAALDRAIAARGPFAAALVYMPSAPPAAWQAVAARTDGGRRIAILTSAHGAPGSTTATRRAAAAADAGTGVLLLGWAVEDGVPRWHTPEEISGAALQMLPVSGLAEAVLGTVEPWSERPAH